MMLMQSGLTDASKLVSAESLVDSHVDVVGLRLLMLCVFFKWFLSRMLLSGLLFLRYCRRCCNSGGHDR